MLTTAEEITLIELLGKMKWPISKDVFHALMPKVVSVPLELCTLDQEGRVLMIHRTDPEYTGYHMPGTVLRDNEDVPTALTRLIHEELSGSPVATPKNIGWVEVKRGTGEGEDQGRHQISLLYLTHIEGAYRGKGEFFPLDAIPDDTLSHHKMLAEKFRQYILTGLPILGNH